MKDKEYVEQLIADMQDAEGQLFTREMLLQRMGYIKACMNNVNVTLSEKEIYNILERVNHGQNSNNTDR